jgi:hypothetical protein
VDEGIFQFVQAISDEEKFGRDPAILFFKDANRFSPESSILTWEVNGILKQMCGTGLGWYYISETNSNAAKRPLAIVCGRQLQPR